MTLSQVRQNLKQSEELASKIKEQAGEDLDFSKVTALEGTVEEKATKTTDILNQIEGYKSELERLNRIASVKFTDNQTVVNSVPEVVKEEKGTRILPASVKVWSTPRNFKGKDALVQAYRFGQFIMACHGSKSAIQYCNDHGIQLKVQQETSNTSGGYLVPHEFSNDMIDLREQYGVFRKYAKIVPMASDSKSDPRRTGGVTAYFVGESDAGTQSTKNWDRVQLVAKKLMVLTKMSSELNEDAVINIGDDLAYEIAYAFANKEDDCGFNGDGTSTYGGIVGVREKLKGLSATIANIAGLTVGAGNAYSELTLANFNDVVAKLPQYAEPGAAWFVHKTFWASVMQKLAYAAGGVTAAEIINGQKTPTFLGYPVVVSQVMPSTEGNSQVCALFGDLSKAARLGDRRQTTISFSDSALNAFEQDEIVIRGTERFDINVHDVGNADATASSRVPGPIVGLITAAS